MKRSLDFVARGPRSIYRGAAWASVGTVLAAVLLAAWLPAREATAAENAPPKSHRPASHRPRPDRRDNAPLPKRDFYYLPDGAWGPWIGVSIAPDTEHWPTNFVPEDYRLKDYDGQANPPQVCRGQTGTTLSTAGQRCPPGQHPSAGARRWSTGR